MNVGRSTLQRGLENAAFKVVKEREAKETLSDEFEAKQSDIMSRQQSEMSAFRKERDSALEKQTDRVKEAEKRYRIFLEAVRLVDEEGLDPIIAKMRAGEDQGPDLAAMVKVLNRSVINSLNVNSRWTSGVYRTQPEPADTKPVPHLHSNHQRRMANRKALK